MLTSKLKPEKKRNFIIVKSFNQNWRSQLQIDDTDQFLIVVIEWFDKEEKKNEFKTCCFQMSNFVKLMFRRLHNDYGKQAERIYMVLLINRPLRIVDQIPFGLFECMRNGYLISHRDFEVNLTGAQIIQGLSEIMFARRILWSTLLWLLFFVPQQKKKKQITHRQLKSGANYNDLLCEKKKNQAKV